MCHGPGRAGGRAGAVRGAGAAAEHRRDAVGQRLPGLLRRDHVDVRVDAAGRGDHVLAGDDLGAGADDEARRDAVHDVRVARLADGDDAAVLDADVALDDAEHRVDDDDAGDHRVRRAVRLRIDADCAMPSRIDLPPPNTASSP